VDQERTLADVVGWAEGEENIRLVVVTGSFARGTADELSDLDIELYVRDPSALLDDRDWYRRFGNVLAVEELENPGWIPTRLVYYVDGKIDFVIGALSVLDRGVSYKRAYRVFVDKDGLGDRLRLDRGSESPPTAEDFRRSVDWFVAAALMQAKDIVRDEPWKAKIRDRDLKDELLQMIQWDHRARYGWEFDTWHLGMHMRGWMDRDVQDELERCWAGFSLEDGEAALLASIELFSRLCGRTADALGYEPFDRARLGDEVERILRSR
jgi:aminoglycoside 6-adenylyltransferase